MSRAVFFDVDGVLVHGYHARPERQLRWDETLLEDLGVDPDRFRDEFIFGVFLREVLVGRLPLVEALESLLPALGYRGSPMTFVQYWLSRDSNIDQELLDIVGRLGERPDLTLYIATNQDHMRAQWLWQTLGFGELFADIFYAARARAIKPSPAFFDFVEARIGRQSEPPLFFDDSPKVIEAARARGWEAVLYDTVSDVTSHPFIAARLG